MPFSSDRDSKPQSVHLPLANQQTSVGVFLRDDSPPSLRLSLPASHPPVQQHPSVMIPPRIARRLFLKTASALAAAPLLAPLLRAQPGDAKGKLIAYVGTYTSPLQNMRPTQVDLPPGNGRGIHLFEVDRTTGAMTPCGVHEMGASPSALAFNAGKTRLYSANETERIGDDEAGSVSAFAIAPQDGK